MGKKKAHLSLFSTFVQQIQTTSNQYSLIDNEYYPSFNSLDELEQFQKKLIDKQQTMTVNDDESLPNDVDMDMKTFAQQFLVDLPDQLQISPKIQENSKRKSNTPVKLTSETSAKRQRRHVRDLPQSSEFVYTTENRRSTNNVSSTIFESLQNDADDDESLTIKNEPIEPEHPTITPTGFGTSELFVEFLFFRILHFLSLV